MKSLKPILLLAVLCCAAFSAAKAANKVQSVNYTEHGIPYSPEFIAKHSLHLNKQGYGDLVTFHEMGATSSVYRTYDWSVSFVQNGSTLYYFYTNDSFTNWRNDGSNLELWLGDTTTPAAGTYDVIVSNISGVGGTYDIGVSFVDANGQDNSSWQQDVITSQHDAILHDVYVDGTHAVDITVDKTEF